MSVVQVDVLAEPVETANNNDDDSDT